VAEAPAGTAERRERLVEVYKQASVCVKCPLSETRDKVVFGAGNSDADLMFVGEAPGAAEDKQGLPFVGRAGAFLTELLDGIGMKREDVFIANTLKCRPPGNRDPQPEEIDSCHPWLEQQVQLIQPRVIGTLGNFATKLLTANQTGITKVHGTPQSRRCWSGRCRTRLPGSCSRRRTTSRPPSSSTSSADCDGTPWARSRPDQGPGHPFSRPAR
jgi:uracil-DNA glycosylase family 4